MDSNEKNWFTEVDAEKSEVDTEKSKMDTEKKARRSSILKPQKPRNPFSTLDFTEPNPDNTLARVARRVSFASSNFVKPFAADPEENTIWDNTYEVEVNHTDSTKSSYEQTKSTDVLNSTSLYSPASKEIWCEKKASPQIIYPEMVLGTNNLNTFNPNAIINDNCTANVGESLLSFVKKSNIKMTLERCSVNKPIDFTLENKTIYTEDLMKVTKSTESNNDISLITPLNDSVIDYTPYLPNSVKVTTYINKENVNPIINDVSLIVPVENKLRRSSRLKSNNSLKTVDTRTCLEKSQNCPSQTIIFNQCDMELTGSLLITDIKENESTKPVINKTVFIEQSMELTKSLDVKDKTHLNNNESKYTEMDAISSNRSDGDMEFTCILPTLIENKKQVGDMKNENSIQLKQHEVDIEITAALPFPGDIKPKNSQMNRIDSIGKTSHFDESDGDVKFSNIFPVTNRKDTPEMFNEIILPQGDVRRIFVNKDNINTANNIHTSQRPINFNQTECNMEFTVISDGEFHTIKNSNLQMKSNHDDHYTVMECNDLPTKNINVNIEERNSDSKRRTIHFNESEDNMELTSTLPVMVKNSNLQIKPNHDGQCIAMDFNDLPIIEGIKVKNNSNSNRRTIHFNESEDDMELTSALPIILKNTNLKSNRDDQCTVKENNDLILDNVKVNIESSNSDSKRKTIHFNALEDNMELTSTLPEIGNFTNLNRNTYNQAKEIKLSILPSDNVKERTSDAIVSEGETVHFNHSAVNMEFTAALVIPNIIEKQKTDSEIKGTFPTKESYIHSEVKRFQSLEGENMELTAPLSNRNTGQQYSINAKKATILLSQYEEDMECTNTLATENELICEKDKNITGKIINLNQTEADMEFTTNLPIKNENLENLAYKTLCTNQDGIKLNLLTKTDTVKNESKLDVSDNQEGVLVNSESNLTTFPKVEENNECMGDSRTSIINKNNTDIKRRSNSENYDDVIKKIKIDNLSLNQEKFEYTDVSVNKNVCDSEKYFDENLVKDIVCKKTKILLEADPLSVRKNETDSNQLHSDIGKEQKVSLQTSKISNSNILYTEPMKINLRTHNFTPIPDLSANLNLQTLEGSLNLNLVPVSTPAVSFHMNLSTMSPCVEDTQQLIYATFSRPESVKALLDKQNTPDEHVKDILSHNKENIISDIKTKKSLHKVIDKVNEKTFTFDQSRGNEKTYVVENSLQLGNIKNDTTELQTASLMPKSASEKRNSYDLIAIHNDTPDNPNIGRSYYIEDISQLALAPDEVDELSLLSDTSNPTNNQGVKLVAEYNSTESEEPPLDNTKSDCSGDNNDYTLRCHSVLANIQKYLFSKVEIESTNSKINLQKMRQIKDNFLLIKDMINNFQVSKIRIVDLKEKHKQDMKESSSSVNKAVLDTEDDKKAPSIAGLMAPKSLYNRICETGERCKKHWKLVKMEDDYYYFLTLFGALPFKVHLHPELGMVYSLETYVNLEDLAKPICWYELNSFQEKLKGEHLISVLGAKFDIFTLLDYISMAMEETAKNHVEYNNLVKKYGISHHFKMNPDFSVTFKIMNIDLIICWTISVKISPSRPLSKDDVTAVSKVGAKVNEEHIKCIAENSPKGPNFFRNFIENIDEYVQRTKKKIKFKTRK